MSWPGYFHESVTDRDKLVARLICYFNAGVDTLSPMKPFLQSSALICLLVASLGALSANPPVDNETGKILAELVRASLEYDYFNARCRGNRASTNTEESNRLLLFKYRLTVNQVIYAFMGRDDRAERAAIEQELLQKLSLKGGCSKAKKGGMLQELDMHYRQLFDQVTDLP